MGVRTMDNGALVRAVTVSIIGTGIWIGCVASALAAYASLGSSRSRGVGGISGDKIFFCATFGVALVASGAIVAAVGGQFC